MFWFLCVFAIGVAAVYAVREADIECDNPPARRFPEPVRTQSSAYPTNAMSVTR
jgi:hypothetical protein